MKIFLTSILLIILSSCSFDNKTGIWSGDKYERERIEELGKEQARRKNNIVKIFSSETVFSEEKNLEEKIILSKPKDNISWLMNNLNHRSGPRSRI